MRVRKKFLPFLTLSLLSFILLIIVVITADPNKRIVFINIPVTPVIIFFSLLFLTTFSLFSFIFRSGRRGFLAGLFFLLFFILRYLGITTWYNIVLLLAIFVLIDILYSR